jgi:hypothetical protein
MIEKELSPSLPELPPRAQEVKTINRLDQIAIGKILTSRNKTGIIDKIWWHSESQTYYVMTARTADQPPSLEKVTSWEIGQLEKEQDWD